MSANYKDYSPGSGSYKVEEAGTIKGISSPGSVCAQMGAVTFTHTAFELPGRGLGLSLRARFNSDHMYSTIINRIAKGEKPAATLMTLPEGQTNFYRICNGWSWDLPKVIIGEKNIFRLVISGKTFVLDSVLTEQAYEDTDPETWAEGFHIKYGTEVSSRKPLMIAIPEAKVIVTCTVEKGGASSPYDFRVMHENDSTYPFSLYLADGSKVKFYPSYLIDGDGTKKADTRTVNHLKDAGQTQWATNVQAGYWAYNATANLRARITGVAASDLTLDCDAFPLGNNTEVYYIYPANAGLVKSITAPDGINTLTFYYNDNGISGNVIAQGSPANKQVTLNATDYSNVRVGDLMTIRDESRVIWSKDGLNKVTVSGAFGFSPTTSDFYHVSQGIIQRVEHSDGRCVKLYYYSYDAGDGFGSLPRLTMVLSSNASMSVLETVDLFLSRFTFYADGLMKIEALEDMPRSAQLASFNTGEANALGYGTNKDEDRFRVLQGVRYEYSLTSDPDPKTDYIAVTNQAGAFTKYFFQKGGFCTQTFSDLATYTGRIKANSTARVLNIEKTDFLLGTDYYLNTSRIKQYAAEDSSVPADYRAISKFTRVSSVLSSTKVKLASDLVEAPRDGDVFLAIRNSGTLNTTPISKSSSPTKAYRVYTDTSKATEGDLIAIRNEVRRIIAEGIEDGATYFDVDREFSFLPTYEGGKDECAYIAHAADDDFYIFYLNKPKVVKIEERRSVDATEWKSTSYAYEYLKGGNETIDDINGGGFIFDDVDGPADSQLRPDSIELTKTTITVWKEGPSKSEDYTQTVISFDYDEGKLIRGEKDTKSFRREGDRWVPVSMTVNVNGNPCTNAAYYGVTSTYTYRNTSQYEAVDGVPNDSQWKERTDFDYDAWGRVVRWRKYSPAFPGGQALVNWAQYLGTGVVEDSSLDPYGKFASNPYASGYQALFDSRLCFEVKAAFIRKINKEDLESLVCQAFDAKLNAIEIREYERTSLTSEESKYQGVAFRSTARKIVDGDGIKTADARTANHLK
ncbi:MAG TPA: hypothetical protein VJ553_06395, partial [Candidatus Paceibacterota bacterium]|nr:hypothetical protein [Candidatus Paceibacterota bacterium]